MPGYLKSLIFAALLCLVCSVLLTAASLGLQPFQQLNLAADRQRNVLKALNIIDDDQKIDNSRVADLYARAIQTVWVDDSGRLKTPDQHAAADLPLCLYVPDQEVAAYVVPIESRGLWGKISGYLAIEKDGGTIRGFTIYQHAETPGLGGEIETRRFRKEFEGKKITNQKGEFVSIRIAKGKVDEVVPPEKRPNYVDGISGATLTGQYLSAGIADVLRNYEPVSIAFRRHSHKAPPLE